MKKTVVTLAINIAAIGSGAPTSPAPSNRYPPCPPNRHNRGDKAAVSRRSMTTPASTGGTHVAVRA